MDKTSTGAVSDPKAISFEGHKRQIEDMVSAIHNNREPLVNGPEGRKSVEIILALYESSKTGSPIKLPLS